ncbi:MAG: AmmeMemoRadiSam system protein A [Chloroflexota bacterium]|nr:AmmeMemoRadiSam system protein A [Chloroflexota bacterium]
MPIEVDEAERDALLEIARLAIAVAVGTETPDLLDAACRQVPGKRRAAAFVTLTEDGRLRGCMGSVDPEAPVWVSVAEAAGWAARSDPRLRPVQPAELDRLEVAVSVLGPLVLLAVPEAFRLGIDGIVVRRGQRRGLLLPEVGERPGIAQRTMLEIACQ